MMSSASLVDPFKLPPAEPFQIGPEPQLKNISVIWHLSVVSNHAHLPYMVRFGLTQFKNDSMQLQFVD